MAYELVEEVLDHAPAMTPAERLLLVAIAELARKGTRSRDIDCALLMKRACLEERGLRHAFNRLAQRGIEVRIPIKVDKQGRPVYAVPGRQGSFYLPHFAEAPKSCSCHRCSLEDPQVPLDPKEDSQVRQADSQVPLGGLTSPAGGLTGPPIPSGETFGLSPDRTTPTRPPWFGGPTLSAKDAQDSIRSTLQKSPMRTMPINGRKRHASFEALMEYPVDTQPGGEPDATPPEL